MKKSFTLVCLMLLAVGTMTAQQKFAFLIGERQLNDGDVITITDHTIETNWEDIQMAKMESGLSVKNISTETINDGAMDQRVTSIPTGAMFSFCFGNCTNTALDKTMTTMGATFAGELVQGTHLAYEAFANQKGIAEVKYLVYACEIVPVKDKPADIIPIGDKTSVTIIYNFDPQSIYSVKGNKFVRLIQDGNGVNLTYNFETNANRTLEVYNVTGQKIESKVISGDNGTVSLSSFESGLYIYKVLENGKIIAADKFMNR